MTNMEKWRIYTDKLVSPDSFINFSFLFLTSAALQRRVWIGDMEFKPVFPNLYLVLVGDPGTGKTLVTDELQALLTHHELVTSVEHTNDPEEKKNKKFVFPRGADSTTFEKLIFEVSKSVRVCKHAGGIYTHTSMYFVLEELSSLVRKEQAQIMKFLLNAYGAGDFVYESLGRGTDIIRRCCVSILAGTTVDFMQEAFDTRLMAQGLTARCLFIFEELPRNKLWEIPPLNEEQKKIKLDLLDYLLALSKCYGRVHFTPEANEYLRHWWEGPGYKVANTSPKLQNYYSKKNMLVKKLCLCLKMSENMNISHPIELSVCEKVLHMLSGVEEKMHLALNFAPKNVLSPIAKSICGYLRQHSKATLKELLLEFYDELPNGDVGLLDVMRQLHFLGKVSVDGENYSLVK